MAGGAGWSCDEVIDVLATGRTLPPKDGATWANLAKIMANKGSVHKHKVRAAANRVEFSGYLIILKGGLTNLFPGDEGAEPGRGDLYKGCANWWPVKEFHGVASSGPCTTRARGVL
jgi:hypothetical protein